jgi:FixJ family two-component response regulator
MRLLIIDDEAHIRQMMRLTLEAAGYDVDEAGTGEDGLARFGDGKQHTAVLLDQKMPGIDGLQTLRQLKERVPGVCVVMVTAFASIELAVDAMRLGATDFLRKPMTPEALRAAVAAAIASQPRTPIAAQAGGPAAPRVETLTLNGFRIVRSPAPVPVDDAAAADHVFEIVHFPDGTRCTVTVAIDPEAVARVARLSRRQLQPGGAFWRGQAERLLSAFLWSEGKVPDTGRLVVRDISREDLDLVSAWTLD